MRYYWVRSRVKQGHYIVYLEKGKDNLANYFTKYHSTKHNLDTRGMYLVTTTDSIKHTLYQVPSNLQGCVKSSPA